MQRYAAAEKWFVVSFMAVLLSFCGKAATQTTRQVATDGADTVSGAREMSVERDERNGIAPAIFVSAVNGDDAATGISRETPLRTVQAAVDRSVPGATITLLPGWHEGGIVLRPGEQGRPVTLRAERRGRVFVGRSGVLSGFEPFAGQHYVYSGSLDDEPITVVEQATTQALRNMVSVEDVAELAGTYFYDAQARRLYVHASDSENAANHTFLASFAGIGVRLADHTVVEGLVFSGFGTAAVRGDNVTGAAVLDCITYGNGYGIELRGGENCLVRGNHAWLNKPEYIEGSQIYVGSARRAVNVLLENNVIHDSPMRGMRFYSIRRGVDCVMRGNLVYNCIEGLYYKGITGSGLLGERNVGVDNTNNDFGAPAGGHNTIGRPVASHARQESDLVVGAGDWRFGDEAYRDYRLQEDSAARGAGPGGSDLGAFQYDGSVLFVRPGGDDGASGASHAAAWRTLGHAVRALGPGQTLYIEPGRWDEPLALSGLAGVAGRDTLVRVRDMGRASFPSVTVDHCRHLVLEGVEARGSAGPLLRVTGSCAVTVKRAAFSGLPAADGHGALVADSHAVTFEHLAIFGFPAGGLRLENAPDFELVSSILGPASRPLVTRLGDTAGYYSQFNVFLETGPRLPEIGPEDRFSVVAGAVDFVAPLAGDFRAKAGGMGAAAGRYGRAAGPHGVYAPRARERIENVEVISVTRTSADIVFWTPGRVGGMTIEWGRTPEYGRRYERANPGSGDYETFHTVSILGLDPGTTYHFRAGVPVSFERRTGAVFEWSGDYTFTTALNDPEPRDLFVSTQGDDARDGLKPETAWRTLVKAGREARAGDVVTIAPGRYRQLLRPLRTGVSEERRIIFRAEKPLTVFLDGGFVKRRENMGRAHCVQLMGKAFITLENLNFENILCFDNGGYRGGQGYGSFVLVSGSAGIEVKNCVFDGRGRYMAGLGIYDAGLINTPDGTSALHVADSLFLNCWYSFQFRDQRAPLRFEHNAFVRNLVSMFYSLGDTPGTVVMRNNIFQSLIAKKSGNALFVGKVTNFDSDFNCFAWDPDNEHRRAGQGTGAGLAGWREATGHDAASLEADPRYPLSRLTGFVPGEAERLGRDPLRIEHLVLPPDSPCRGAGEGGADIGPRWERFLNRGLRSSAGMMR